MADLCQRCERVFSLVKICFTYPAAAAYNSVGLGRYGDLQKSAENSQCQLCCLIISLKRRDIVDQIFQDGHEDDLHCVFDFPRKDDQTLLLMDIFPTKQRDATIFTSYVMFRKIESEVGVGSNTETSTWSYRSVQLVQEWLAECLTHHKACPPLSAAKRLPLRFLEIDLGDEMPQSKGGLDESGNIDSLSLKHMPRVKLVSTTNLASNTQYLTLSHCWGRSPVAKLSNRNLNQYLQSIPPQTLELPTAATFRQAIYVAYCLRFRFLWIDALCINQDDGDEKGEEISYMDKIYAHATLNLSATAAQDGSGGLLFDRDPRKVIACQSTRHPDIVAFLMPLHSFVDEVLSGPINKRAWVFQERMLAMRVLHFCRTRLFWECCTLQEAQPLSCGIPRSMVLASGQTKRLVLPGEERGRLSADKARLRWADIVQRYSRTFLTFPGDTLLAVSAIANTLCEQRGLGPSDYIAGLWVPDLPLALRWRVSRQPDKIPDEYVAPSWSWAALFCDVDIERDVYVRTFADNFVPSIRLKKASFAFGSVAGGSLRVRGMLRSLRYLESEDCFRMGQSDSQAPSVISSGFPGTIRDGLPDKLYKWSKQGQRSMFVQESGQSHNPPLDESDVLICEWDHGIPGHDRTPEVIRFALSDGKFLEVKDASFFLFPLGQRKRSSKEDQEGEEENEAEDRIGPFDRVEGLILHRSFAKGEYVRVGIFYYTLHDSFREEQEVLGSVFGKNECLEDDSYIRKEFHDGETTYTIDII